MAPKIQESTSLAPYTIYKIGGPARFFTEVKNYDELTEALRFAQEKGVVFFVLGAGSNILVSDQGFDGLVIHMVKGKVMVEGTKLIATADVMMAQAVMKSVQAGLTGFEWAIGVPGTIGGSVRGNAGCFGGEMSQVVESVKVLETKNRKSKIKITNPSSKIFSLDNADCRFSYRDSIFKRHSEWIIVSAALALQKGDPQEIQARIAAITRERSEKQDIGAKSCGCIFKNIPWGRKDIDKKKLLARFSELAQFKDQPNIPASFLLDQAGLKGRRVGKVLISPKHANYFVNSSPTFSTDLLHTQFQGSGAPDSIGDYKVSTVEEVGDKGGATAEEVVMLISIAKDVVRRKYGIILEEEIQYVGF